MAMADPVDTSVAARRLLVGHRRLVHQCEGAAPASDWLAWEQAGRAPPSGDGNGFATRYAEDFALLAEPRPHPPPPVDRVGPASSPSRASATPPRSSTTSRCSAPARRRRHRAVGVPAPLHAPGLVLGRRARVRRRAQPRRTTGPATSTSSPRPSATWCSAGSRSTSRRPTRCSAGGSGCSRPASPTAERFAEALEAIHLATFDAAIRLRADAASRWRRSTTSRRSARSPTPCPRRRGRPRPARPRPCAACWIGGGARRRSSQVPGRAPIERPEFQTRFDLSASRTTTRMASTADGPSGRTRPTPASARMGYAPWSEGLGIVLHRLAEDLPGQPLLVAEHGIGTDDDGWREAFLRESLGSWPRRDRRRHRPARLLPLDRGRQLRVDLRLLASASASSSGTGRRSPAPRSMRAWATASSASPG